MKFIKIKVQYFLICLLAIYYFVPVMDMIKYRYGNFAIRSIDKVLTSALNYMAFFFVSFFAIWIVIIWKNKISKSEKVSLIVITVSSLVFLIFSKYLILLEQNNYPNYLYSKFGLYFDELSFMSNSCLIILLLCSSIVYKIKYWDLVKVTNEPLRRLMELIFPPLVLIGFLLIVSFPINMIASIGYAYKVSQLSYNIKYGEDYKYIQPILKFVPTNGNFIHPPQSVKWAFIGNQPTIRYFLFPRILISGNKMTSQKFANDVGEAYFILLEPNKIRESWPIIDQDDKTVIFDETDKISYVDLSLISGKSIFNVYKIKFK